MLTLYLLTSELMSYSITDQAKKQQVTFLKALYVFGDKTLGLFY